MKVLVVNTSELTGGAAIAAGRLAEALTREGVEVTMLVRDASAAPAQWVMPASTPVLDKVRFVAERGLIFAANGLQREGLFGVDIGAFGHDITRLPAFREADVIHLHWVNQSFLSMADIRRVLRSGKPVVWTLHDQWPFTAICHYSDGCRRFTTGCFRCPQLGGLRHPDIARMVFRAKRRAYAGARLAFVGCSRWIAGLARESALTAGHEVTSIPNPFPVWRFLPLDRAEARRRLGLPADRRLVLFASAKVTDPRKGLVWFVQACRLLADGGDDPGFDVAVMGGHAEELASMLPGNVHLLGYVNGDEALRAAYSAADLFVTPSLQDNLPNTIVEAMACGTPCVAFATGGIPEMITHGSDGFLAAAGSAEKLADGISFILGHDAPESLRKAARRKAETMYGDTARSYIDLYSRMIEAR